MAGYAASLGITTKVAPAAGVSSHMTDAKANFAVNAAGAVNVDEVFGEVIAEGGSIAATEVAQDGQGV